MAYEGESESGEAPDGSIQNKQLERLRKWSKQHDSHWAEWREEARTCYDMVAGEQWPAEAKKELEDMLGKVPVVFNRIDPMISAVSGAEITNRQEVRYYAREATGPDGQAEANEIITAAAEWARDECDAGDEESDAFWDTLVCGMGWTETRMDSTDGQPMPIVERVDPLEMSVDPSARKKNAAEARCIRRRKKFDCDEYEEKFGEDFEGGSDKDSDTGPHENHPGDAYDNAKEGEATDADTVTVDEWQWWEIEKTYLIAGPEGTETLSEDEHEKLQEAAQQRNIPIQTATVPRKRWYRAYLKGKELIGQIEELPDGEFTYKCVTGKRDRNKKIWYGLVRPMVDPQRWSNKFYSQIIHIINANAKGGVMYEEGAVDDPREFEENWARSDSATMVADGAISQGKIQPKPQTAYPQGLDRLMQVAIQGVSDVTGIPKELMGMSDRDQPGVLEMQRKQAAYGLLSPFFDALKRYRRAQGRLLLKYICKYIPDDTLVRIVGQDGGIQYLPLLKDEQFARYDVIVDEAPAGPNQKERVFALLTQFMPLLKDAGPEIMAEIVKYSPLPTSLTTKIVQHLAKASEPNPEAEEAKQIGKAQAMAVIGKDEAAARKTNAEADQTMLETALMPDQVAAEQAQVRINM